MADRPVPNGSVILQEFIEILKQYTVYGACAPYLQISLLKTWWEKDVGFAAGVALRRIDIITDHVYENWGYPAPPISVDEICRGETNYLLVFNILLELGRGKEIHIFRKKDLSDNLLPIPLGTLKEKLTDGKLADDFNRIQWRYCPARLHLDRSHEFPFNRIVPTCRKESISTRGGTADLWQIAVQEEFVELKLRDKVRSSRFRDAEFGWCYRFALKTFREGNGQLFRNEIEAFRALRGKEGMIQCLGSYEHSEITSLSTDAREGTSSLSRSPLPTSNIILEYADLDLEEYFDGKLPPILEGEVADFWKDMFEVADAVEGIHDLEISNRGVPQHYYGWHADIKPANILIVKGDFRLADPGFARFEKEGGKDSATILGTTATYGAPECFTARIFGTPVQRSIDIWSLGCVYSVAATWVVLGKDGIRQFDRFRDIAVQEAMLKQKSKASLTKTKVELTRGDYFHDGHDVLPDIRDWHNFLRRFLRQTDTITSQVLELVEQNMLKGKPEQRLDAGELCKKLKVTLKTYRNRPKEILLPRIMQALLSADEAAPERPLSSKQVPSIHLKSKQIELPALKTTHRSEFLRSELSKQGVDAYRDLQEASPVPNHQWPNLQQGRKAVVPKPPENLDSIDSSFNTISPGPVGTRAITRAMTETPIPEQIAGQRKTQNVFQARDHMEKHKTKYLKKLQKDDFLTRHFRHRDIKFLVDNGWSMEPYWYEAGYLLETLVMRATGQDPDGMDLDFTNGPVHLKNSKKPGDFKEKMENKGARPMEGTTTDLSRSLAVILDGYRAELASEIKAKTPLDKIKRMTLIVLTDGKWEGLTNKEEVGEQIVQFVKDLEKITGAILEKRRVSIEFIQFGSDEDATQRLRKLDNELPYTGIPDIVDTEPSYGDLYKMLLGSFIPEFDNKDDALLSPPSTPSWANSEVSLPQSQQQGITGLARSAGSPEMRPRTDTNQSLATTSQVKRRASTQHIRYEDHTQHVELFYREHRYNNFDEWDTAPSDGSNSGQEMMHEVEAKTTVVECDTTLFMIKNQCERMRREALIPRQRPRTFHVIVSIFNLLSKNIGLTIFVDPWQVKDSVLDFVADQWKVTPRTSGVH